MKYKNKSKHVNVIEQFAIAMEFEGNNDRYLELGIDRCHCFHAVGPHFKESYAVDRSQDSINKINIPAKKFAVTTDEFFEKHCNVKFNLIFIDARHKWRNVKQDFDNSIKVLAEDGLILSHDSYSPNSAYSKHCVDAWKIQPHVRKEYPEYQYVNLPFYFGISVVKRNVVKDWWQK